MFRELKPYQSIAWDFDETLIKHEKSPLFWRFIAENPYGQVHHIVTMRSHGMERSMFVELLREGCELTEANFKEVISLPNSIYESYTRDKWDGNIHPEHAYHTFKGEHCKGIGAEVLVDDMEADAVSLRGCEIHGIIHYHPDELSPTE